MNRYDAFYDKAALIRKVPKVAREHGYDGDIYDDEERIHRDPSFEEQYALHQIFTAVQQYYVLAGSVWNFVRRLVWNAVMNSRQSLRDRGFE